MKKQNNWKKRFDKDFNEWFEINIQDRYSHIQKMRLKVLIKSQKELSYKEGYKIGTKKNKETLEELKLGFNVWICDCGDEWKNSDAADIVNQALNNIKKKIRDEEFDDKEFQKNQDIQEHFFND